MTRLFHCSTILLAVLWVVLNPAVHAQEKTPPLGGKVTLGSSWYSGNIERFDFRLGGDLTHIDSVYEFNANAGFLYSETDLMVKNREYHGSVKYDYLPYSRISPFLMVAAYSNRFKGIGLRVSGLAGAKYRIYHSDVADYSISAALQADFEYYALSGGEEDPLKLDRKKLRLSVRPKIKQKIGSLLTLEHVTFYQPAFDDWSDYRIASRTALNTKITPAVQFGISYDYELQTRPPDASIKKEDHLVMANITVKF